VPAPQMDDLRRILLWSEASGRYACGMSRFMAAAFALTGFGFLYATACSSDPVEGTPTVAPATATSPPPTATATTSATMQVVPPPVTCTDGIKNGMESDVDCGGACSPCATMKLCVTGADCQDKVCEAGRCAAATGLDKTKNGNETDIDCGGDTKPCLSGLACKVAADCQSKLCTADKCEPTISDGQRNGSETDVDCGGPNAPSCRPGRRCAVETDCESKACIGKICQAATHTDQIRNLDETGVDCGGPDAKVKRCGNGEACIDRTDCLSNSCNAATKRCQAPAINQVKDGDETDVDCGGVTAPPCAVGLACLVGADCASASCNAGRCIAPRSDDGIRNNSETDVDCGGPNAPACSVGKTCNMHGDCSSSACSYKRVCVKRKSCTPRFGGDTCGPGETGTPEAMHEDCCAEVAVTGGPTGNFTLDKYQITAGRVRQFMERVSGNVRGFIQQNRPAGWDPRWDKYLPVSMMGDPGALGAGPTDYLLKASSGYQQVAFGVFYNQGGQHGCNLNAPGGTTYWIPPDISQAMGDIAHLYPQDVLDEKSWSCPTALMVAAFCHWDGGRLPTIQELDFMWQGAYPWGAAPQPAGFNPANGQKTPANGDIGVANYFYGYQYPARQGLLDYTPYIAAPGRYPRGNGKLGVADLGGNLFEHTSFLGLISGEAPGIANRWSRNGSWEGHQVPYPAHSSPILRRYGKVGGRCAR
jgi:formylglycine-generating enzyme required for sulfatase activity